MVRYFTLYSPTGFHLRQRGAHFAGCPQPQHQQSGFLALQEHRRGPDSRLNLQFRAEFYNLFNRVQFDNPGTALGTPQFGVVTNQFNDPRLIQFALKLAF